MITIFEAAILSPNDSDAAAARRFVFEPTDSDAFVAHVLDISGRHLGVSIFASLEQATRMAERVYGRISDLVPVTVERHPYPAPGAFPRPPRGRYRCPVCSAHSLNEPAYDYFGLASFAICPECGTEFGFDDVHAMRPGRPLPATDATAASHAPPAAELKRDFALARSARKRHTRAATPPDPDSVRYMFVEASLGSSATAFFFDRSGKRLGQESFPSRESAIAELSARFELDVQGWRAAPGDAPLP